MSLRLLLAVAGLAAAAWVAPAAAHVAVPAGGIGGVVTPPPGFCPVTTCVTVTYETNGTGSGRVTSDPAGLDCTVTAGVESGTCMHTFLSTGPAVEVALISTPAPGSLCQVSFGEPQQGPCRLTYGGNKDDFKTGDPWFVLMTPTLSVSRSGAGSGKVTSAPAGIDCGSTCSKAFDYGTKVTLTAAPDAGAVFRTWTGACNGQGATCTLTVTEAVSTNAVFELPAAETASGAATGGTDAGAAATGAQEADATVEADVIGVRAARSRIGKRIVQLELVLDERVAATLRLMRAGKTLAKKRLAAVKPGSRVLTLPVSRRVKKGKAALRVELVDAAGNTMTIQRKVRLPAVRRPESDLRRG